MANRRQDIGIDIRERVTAVVVRARVQPDRTREVKALINEHFDAPAKFEGSSHFAAGSIYGSANGKDVFVQLVGCRPDSGAKGTNEYPSVVKELLDKIRPYLSADPTLVTTSVLCSRGQIFGPDGRSLMWDIDGLD